MDKRFIKQVISIVKDIDNEDYISSVKYVIFFISKVLFACKLLNCNLLDTSFSNIMSKDVLSCDEMGIFKTYNSFNLNRDKVEYKIYSLICDYKDCISYNNFIPANLYELLLTPTEKKSMGQVYTPLDIIDKMLSHSFSIKSINKDLHILDPSCGGGYFLIEAFKRIRNELIFEPSENSDKYILENMIYGIDVDEFSIFLTKMGLLFTSSCTNVNFNIFNSDFLTETVDCMVSQYACNGYNNSEDCELSMNITFDIIIGNPPYIGHKQTNKEYRALLKEKFKDVFYDKSDISYCFFKMSKDLLKKDGIICFITSRYFMEAMYADKLRGFIKNGFQIVSINDYNGIQVFKGAMISPLVITLCNNVLSNNQFSYVKYSIDESKTENISYEQKKLKNNGWVILNNKEEELFNRIESISNTYISDVCSIKQGIITGFDKAFIVTEKEIEQYDLERFLLKKWIKNSNITRTNIKYNNLYLIYTNIIEDERDCPNTLNYLKPFKDKLMNRRECKNGIRKWYELQWGRVQSDFETPKILFPYKSCGNNFFYDTNKFFCSADIYFINKFSSDISSDYLQNYLNSSIFEFYFKCKAKKVGIDIFEYYPNKLKAMKIYLPDGKNEQKLSHLGKFSIENFLEKVFNIIGKEEKAIINKYISKKGDDAK